MIGQFVIIRCHSAGVHCGILVSRDGQNVELKDARRIWRWRGAHTLNELSQNGASLDYTRISDAAPIVFLAEICEIIPCSDKAQANLIQSRWAQ